MSITSFYKINLKNIIYTYFYILKSLLINIFIDRYNDSIIFRADFINFYSIILFLSKHSALKANMLLDIAAVDLPGKLYRFNLNYILNSLTLNQRFVVSTFSNEVTWVQTLTPLFPSANWYEREVWDMFGIFFQYNYDLRRILNDYGFAGFPLRKDFPVSGFYELRFHENYKQFKYAEIKNIKFRQFIYFK